MEQSDLVQKINEQTDGRATTQNVPSHDVHIIRVFNIFFSFLKVPFFKMKD